MGIWDKYNRIYDKLYVQKVSLKPTRDMIIEKLKEIENNLKNKGIEDEGIREKEIKDEEINELDIIDIGCGTGQLLCDIRDNFKSINLTGLEPSKLGDAAKDKGLYVIKSSIEDFEPKAKYDIAFCTHSFPYYRDKEGAVKKIYGLLKNGGYFLIANATTNNLYDKIVLSVVKLTTSKAYYPSRIEMENFLKPFFNIIEVKNINRGLVSSIQLFVCRGREDFESSSNKTKTP